MPVYDNSGSLKLSTYAEGGSSPGSSTVQWVESSTSPRLRTTASVAIGAGSVFAENIGTNVNFYVSGTIVTSSGEVNVFGGSTFMSGNLYIQSSEPSQSFIQLKIGDDPLPADQFTLRINATHRASRSFLETRGFSGLDTILQPAIFNNAVMLAGPNTTTTLTSYGGNFTTSGTVAHSAVIATPISGLLGNLVNARFTPASAIGNGSGIRTTAEVCWRGNYSGAGGWYTQIRHGVFINSPSRMFVGFNSANAFNGHTTDISAATNFIGIGWDRLDPLTGTWRVMRRDGSTYVTEQIPNMIRTDTTGSLIDFISFAAPNSTGVFVQVLEHKSTSTGIQSFNRFQQFFSTSIPAPATFLRMCGGIYTQTGTAAGNFFMNRFYLETDY
jgi:hypothetical protein